MSVVGLGEAASTSRFLRHEELGLADPLPTEVAELGGGADTEPRHAGV